MGIVTGASRGIGAVLADRLGQLRPDLDEIWCISRSYNDDSYCEDAEFSPRQGPRVRHLGLDQSDDDFGDELRNHVERHHATIVYLILNAAYADYGDVNTQEFSQADQMIQTNIRGTVAAVYSLNNLFEKNGHIILVSSISAVAPTPGLAVYTASKAFIRHWGISLREEFKFNGVTVTICYPGKVKTTALRNVVKQAKSVKLRLMPEQNLNYLVERTLRAAEKGRAEVAPGLYGLVMILFKALPKRVVARFARLV
ncbi:SDR family NAD(P)-dependent oxidoreductase [Corynebacterium amycolatum]|uniref:SDR family NAD(P)-dependent oxidoreductase n=1 Tax=Corynebacterium amycolatum TaxID=43765 RepID=UPI003EDF34FF